MAPPGLPGDWMARQIILFEQKGRDHPGQGCGGTTIVNGLWLLGLLRNRTTKDLEASRGYRPLYWERHPSVQGIRTMSDW